MAGNSPGYLRQPYPRSRKLCSARCTSAAPQSCWVAQDRNALDRDLSHLPGEAADSQSGSSGLDGTYFLPAVNSFKSSWWMPFFVKLLIALLLAITSGRDCGDTITGPGKDLGKITRVYENVPSSAPAESFFPEWRGSYSALCSRPFFSIGAAYASPQGEPNQKKKVTEKELPLPANLQVSKRIAFPDPIFGQVTFQCPPDYDLLFNQCQKKVVRPPMPSCPYGSYMNEDGNCISVDSVPAERTCSAGYQPYEKGCVRRDLIQAIPFCNNPEFQLFQRGPEAECVQLMERDPLFSCHEGILEDGLCITRTQEEPAVSCSLGFDLVTQDLRPSHCERVVFVDPEQLCDEGWSLSPHPETGEMTCISIRRTPPVPVCPEEGDYTLIDDNCVREELTEPEPMCPPGFVFNKWDALCRRVRAEGAVPVCREGWRYVEETGKCTLEEEPTYICEGAGSGTHQKGFGELPKSWAGVPEVSATISSKSEWDSTDGPAGIIDFECATVEIAPPRMGCAAGELLLMHEEVDGGETLVENLVLGKASLLRKDGSSGISASGNEQEATFPSTQKSRLHQKKVMGEGAGTAASSASGRMKMAQLRRGGTQGASASAIAVAPGHDGKESLKMASRSVSGTDVTPNPQERKRRSPLNGPVVKPPSREGGKDEETSRPDRRMGTPSTEGKGSPIGAGQKWIENQRLAANASGSGQNTEVPTTPGAGRRRLSSLLSGSSSVEGDGVCRVTISTKPTLMPAACPVQAVAGVWSSLGKETLEGECVEVHVQRPRLRCPSGKILDDAFVSPRCEQVEIEPPTMLCPDGSSPSDGRRCIRLDSQPPLALCEEHYEVQASTGRCVRALQEPPGWTCPTGYRLPETELPAQSAKEIVAPHLGSRKGDSGSPVIIGPPLPPVQAGFCERVEFSNVQFVCPVGFGRVKDKKTKEWVCVADKAVPSTLLCESGFFLEDGLCVMHLRMAPSLVDQDGRPFPCVTRPDGTNSCGHAAPYPVALGADDAAKHSRPGAKK